MAKKRRSRSSWLQTLLFFVLTPLTVWALAFVVWLYWAAIKSWLAPEKQPPTGTPRAARKADPYKPPPQKPSGEKILEEDRKKLEAILKEKTP